VRQGIEPCEVLGAIDDGQPDGPHGAVVARQTRQKTLPCQELQRKLGRSAPVDQVIPQPVDGARLAVHQRQRDQEAQNASQRHAQAFDTPGLDRDRLL